MARQPKTPDASSALASGITSTGSGILLSIGASAIEPIVSSMLFGFRKEMGYGTNIKDPLTIPAVEQLLNAWVRGSDSYQVGNVYNASQKGMAHKGLRMHGVYLNPQGIINQEVMQDLDIASRSPGQRHLLYNCMNLWNKVLEYSFAYPSPDAVVKARMANLINADEFPKLMRRAGAKPEEWHTFQPLLQSHLDPIEARSAWFRGLIEEYDFNQLMALRGLVDDNELNIFKEMGWETPTMTDLKTYLVKQADDIPYIVEMELWQGFDTPQVCRTLMTQIQEQAIPGSSSSPEFQALLAQVIPANVPSYLQFRNFYKTFKKWLDSAGFTQLQAFMEYVSRANLPAPEQAAHMYQRLRPERVTEIVALNHFTATAGHDYDPSNQADRTLLDGLKQSIPNDPALQREYDSIHMSRDRLRKTLMDREIPPSFIEKFIETSYRPVGLRDIRQLFGSGVWDDPDALAALQDIGTSPQQSRQILSALKINTARTQATNGHGYSVPGLCQMYLNGEIDETFLRDKMTRLTYPVTVQDDTLERLNHEIQIRLIKPSINFIKRQFMADAISNQQTKNKLGQLNISTQHSQVMVNEWNNELAEKRLADNQKALADINKDRIAAIRKCYLSYHMEQTLAQNFMAGMDIHADVQQAYLELWNLERFCNITLPNKTELVSAAKKAIITPSVMAQYLLATGHGANHVSLLVSEVLFHIAGVAAKNQEKLTKAIAQQLATQAKKNYTTAQIQFNLARMLKQADLVELLPTITDKLQQAQAKAGVARQIAFMQMATDKNKPALKV